jgi:hypothetical protein
MCLVARSWSPEALLSVLVGPYRVTETVIRLLEHAETAHVEYTTELQLAVVL